MDRQSFPENPNHASLNDAGGISVPKKPNSSSEVDRTIAWCIFLIFYFSTCDTILKFLPPGLGTVLRYLPEAILYLLAARSMKRNFTLKTFPLVWPLLACGIVMLISGVLNNAIAGAVTDFRVFFRFAAFSYIFYNLDLTVERALRFFDGFFALTTVQLVVGGLELIGGDTVKLFFTPALGWGGTGAPVASKEGYDQALWIAGTLANYNDYGLFMVLSGILALSLYLALAKTKYLWLTGLSILAALLSSSRHCLILFAVSVPFILYFQRTRIVRILKPLILIVVFASVMGAVVADSSSSGSITDRATSLLNAETFASDNPQENIRLFMMVLLPQRFLTSYPLFGQGAIPLSEQVAVGDSDTSSGPTLKAAPELPGWVTFYLSDVVWLMLLCLYGIFGVLSVASVFLAIAYFSRKLWKTTNDPGIVSIAQACGLSTLLVMIAAFFSQEVVARDVIPIFWCVAGIVFSSLRQINITSVEKANA